MLALACMAGLGVSQLAAAANYTKVKIRHQDVTRADVINNGGAVAGEYGNSMGRAFIRTPDGAVTTFAVDGAVVTIPRGFTDLGAVGGRYDLPDDTIHGFFRDAVGSITPFDGPGLGAAEISGMNAANDIAGTYFIDEQQDLGGFIRHEDGSITVFSVEGARPGGLSVAGIGAKGEVAGAYTDANFVRHGFLRSPKGKLAIIDVPGSGEGFGQGTDVIAVNDKGWIGGSYTDANDAVHHYVRKPDSTLETFDRSPGVRITAINNSGDLTGCFPSNFKSHGFVRKASGKFIAFDLPWGDSEDLCAQDINDSGQVTGYVRYGAFGETQYGFIRAH